MASGVLAQIAERKRRDVAHRLISTFDPSPTRKSLLQALTKPGARFVLEVKKASPSGHRSSFGVEEAVDAYAPIADAISVLTDTPFFDGSLHDLRTARERFDGPILAKDFIVDPRQVGEARAHGADAVLVILAMLDDDQSTQVMSEAKRFAMDVVVEVHDEPELRRALAIGAKIVGINNRDLRTLKTDLKVTEELAALVPRDRVVISESGIRHRDDVERLSRRVDAFLVGSSLMASRDVSQAAKALVYGHVKVCGITQPNDASFAANMGATHLGLIFAEHSPRRVSNALALVEAGRRAGAEMVGVFQDQDMAFVAQKAHELGLSAVQLHGSEGALPALRGALPEGCEIWASCAPGELERPGADRIIYDSKVGGRSGGTGRAFDWSKLVGRSGLANSFLAGGIDPTNARQAQAIGTFGIDLSSGVESAPGHKDPAKIAALFDALRPVCRKTA
jgi:indole-3-glycerol phosphate synthase/phosphoribosylanthranilate isomerase